MKNKFLPKYLQLFLMSTIIAISFAFNTAVPNFSGTWRFNEAKSEMNNLPAWVANQMLVIEQKGNTLKVQHINDSLKTEFNNIIDNSPSETIGSRGSKIISIVQWGTDGTLKRTLKISSEQDTSKEDYKREEIWQLKENGKRLIITQTVIPSDGQPGYSFKAAYDKQ